MSKRLFSVASFTPTAQADGVLSAGTYAAQKGGASTDVMKIWEITQVGQASASAFNEMTATFSSTLGITPTTLALPNSDAFTRPGATAYGTNPVAYVAAATNPNRSPAYTIPRWQIGFNSFGGIFRYNPPEGSEPLVVGNATTSQSEIVYSAMNSASGTSGAQSLQVTYEMI